jgi:hypothetical protein
MLTLAGSFRVRDHTIFRDVARTERQWAPTSRFYVLPDRPQLAHDADGRLLFEAVRYRGSPAADGPRGAVITLSIDLSISAELIDQLKEHIRTTLQLAQDSNVEIASVPVVAGTVALAFAAESGEADFVRRLGGNGNARLSGRERASFLIDLTEDAASLLWTALDANVDVLHARYEFDVQHVLGDLVLRVWCDARRAHTVIAGRLEGGSLTPQDLRQVLHDEQAAGYEIVSERVLANEERTRLDELGATMLEEVLSEALFALDSSGGGRGLDTRRGHATLRPFSEALSAQVNRQITQSSPVIGHLVVDDVLPLARIKSELAEHVREVELDSGASRVLDVTLQCTVNFADDQIERVKATITPLGGDTAAPGEFLFREGVAAGRYRVDVPADASHRYRIDALIYYQRDPQPYAIAYPESDRAIAVLDLDGVGVLTVDVGLGDIPFDRIRQVKVEMNHPATGAVEDVVLDVNRPTARWRTVVRDQPRIYRRRAVWLLNDDSRVEEPWEETTDLNWVLNAPARLRQGDDIVLISAGSFANVAQIVIELRGGQADVASRFTFTGPAQSQTWHRDGSTTAGQPYEMREVAVDRDGRVNETAWHLEDRPVIVVRDRTAFVVRIIPRLLPLGPDHPIALLTLQPVDGPDAANSTTLTLREGSDASWTFRIADPERHRYRHQVTLVARTGAQQAGSWQDGDAALLVPRLPA